MRKFLVLPVLATLLAACGNDDDCRPNSGAVIRLAPAIASVTPISPTSPTSRTSISGSTAAWINGDALGLFCAQSNPAATNLQFTASNIPTNPTWTPATALYWMDGTTAHKFLAYAPYASGNSDPAAVKLPAINSQTGTIVPAQDFLISNGLYTDGVTRTGSVALTFTHALALIELDVILGSGIAAGTTLTSITLAAGATDKLYTSGNNSTINLTSGAITAGTTTNTADITPATAPTLSATATPIYALILPGTFTAPNVTLNIKEGGSTSLTTATASLGTTTFEAKKKYAYQVTVGRTAITISNPTITDWVTVNGSPITPGI